MTYIDPRGKPLAHLGRLAGWQAGQTPAPVTVEWDLSNRCSLGCQDCHFAHTHSRGPWALKPRTLPMAFDSTGDLADTGLVERVLGEMTASGVQGIVFSGGGEPTLHPAWLTIARLARAHGLQVGMYTLGGHFTAESALALANLATFVVVSLDAIDAATYAHDKGVAPARFTAALDGITWLSGHSAAVGVSYLLHAGNWSRAESMVAFTRELGATYTTLRPAVQFRADLPSFPVGDRAWITDALPVLERLAGESDVEVDPARFAEYRDWRGHGYEACAGIRLTATVTPDGRVWVCPNRRGMPESCLGDLRAESFADLWARHPGRFVVDGGCRVSCRLHPVNQTLAALDAPRMHEAFV